MCRSWIFATPDYTDTFSYILVHTRTYLYMLVHTRTYYHTTPCTSNWIRLVMMYCRCCTPTPKLPQPLVDFIDIAAPQSVRCSRVGTAIRKAWILALAEYVRNCWSRVTSQKQWHKRNSAHHILDICHVEAEGCGWFIQLDHSSVLHRPLNRQFELFKGTEENQGVYYVIRACFVGSVFRQSSILWSQNTREEKLGTDIPAVLQGNIVSILFNAERIRRDHKYGILHIEIQHISVCTHTYYDLQSISEYIL